MSLDLINNIIANQYKHFHKNNFLFEVKEIFIGHNLIGKLKYLAQSYSKVLIIADIACNNIIKILPEYETYIFTDTALPTIENIEKLINIAKDYDLFIAVGSGAINDISKIAAKELNIPWFLFATAPSMNGYGNYNASIIKNKVKSTKSGKLPIYMFFDIDIIALAPIRLIKAGVGDMACLYNSWADWYMSHKLFSSYYNDFLYDYLFDYWHQVRLQINEIISGDKKAILVLLEGLILMGLFMSICGGSYPASQAEHIIAHTYNSLAVKPKKINYHGEEISYTTLLMDKLQYKILQLDLSKFDPSFYLRRNFSEDLKDLDGYKYKVAFFANEKNLENFTNNSWQEVKDNILSQFRKKDGLRYLLSQANLPSDFRALEWEFGVLRKALKFSVFLRDRITFLDLAFMSGVL